MDIPEIEYQGDFLRQWTDTGERGRIVLMFINPVKMGSRRPDLIIKDVVRRATFGIQSESYPESKKANLSRLIKQIEDNPEDTTKFVEFLIERESWPVERKRELRKKQKAFYDRLKASAHQAAF
jgi:hypothetical protein